MYELVANQVFGIDGLVNLSNIVFLIAFSAKDVLKLRILIIFWRGGNTPVFLLSARNTMGATFLSAAFTAVNAVRIVATALERRPVVLSEKEEQVHRIAFTFIEKTNF